MNSEIYVKSRECWRAISECLLHANFTCTSRNTIMHPETFRTERAIFTHRCKQKHRRMLECTKEAIICIDNIELTNFNQINHNFCTFQQKNIM